MIQTGIAVNNSFAVLEALIGLKSEFIRTPKLGVIDKKEKWRKRFYTTKVARPFIPLIELFFGCASLFGVISAIQNQIYFILPFYIIYTIAFFYIFIVDILQNRFLVLN
jgi:hypothetical protein